MPYNPNLPALSVLATRLLVATTQDDINSGLKARDEGHNGYLRAVEGDVSADRNSKIDGKMNGPPMVELLPGPAGNLSAKLHLAFLAGSSMILNGNNIPLDGWSVVIQGPLVLEPMGTESLYDRPPPEGLYAPDPAGQSSWKVKLAQCDAVTVLMANKTFTTAPLIDPVVEDNLSSLIDLLEYHWNWLPCIWWYDLLYFSWPTTGPRPVMCFSQWKTYSSESMDDGIPRPLNPLFISAPGGENQLVIVDEDGPSLPTPLNWVPLDIGTVLIMARVEFLETQVLYAIDNAVPEPERGDSMDTVRRQWDKIPIVYWPPSALAWTSIGELSAFNLRSFTYNDIRVDENFKFVAGTNYSFTISYIKPNIITITGDISMTAAPPGWMTPPGHLKPTVDLTMLPPDGNGILSFVPQCTVETIVAIQDQDLVPIWSEEPNGLVPKGILRFTGYNAATLRGFQLPSAAYFEQSSTTISATTFDFSAKLAPIIVKDVADMTKRPARFNPKSHR